MTFGSSLSSWTPEALIDEAEGYELDIIAPFWADVDTRSTNSGVTTYGTNTVDGRVAFGVSWINVGYYSSNYDKLNSFQLVLIDRSDRTNGDFDLEFNYARIQWEQAMSVEVLMVSGPGGIGGYVMMMVMAVPLVQAMQARAVQHLR